ncbi:cell division protein FtsW [Aneurinibacillus soli]|uniref:Probable peptidoglycan glycosyltransferase FtsW n=1 Tax=Aneurinibacillus soli TaxID=1500254 RepID=A0A0U4WB95_9BACL|nr:putative lipid II flippase FtsW [Aneurinibacillus soli]PYE57647.1 cell division protein FtsW [Aneurinibacillus soli]BAU26121.1 Lipid II flippase FtsW [Aneurinibacillus soli]
MKTRGRPDFVILIFTLLFVGFGIVMVYSASSVYALNRFHTDTYFVKKQLISAVIGLVAMSFAMNIPYTFYKKNFVQIALGIILLLLLVLIPGIGLWRNGARSWLNLGIFQLQPAEFAKLAVVIYLSALISKKGQQIETWKKGLQPAITVIGIFGILIAAQPDMGSAAILGLTAVSVLVAGGAKFKYLLRIAIPIAAAAIALIVTSPYRMSRVTNIGDPWSDGMNGLGSGFQLAHSYFAIAHGGMVGTGFGKSIEKYLYLPEVQTDFIFSIIGEELGFIGATLFLILFILYLWRIILITRRVNDLFANLIGIGVASMISIQALVNIGGVTGLIAITGVPLPFISYGGSSLLLNMLSIGIVLSISREAYRQAVQKAEGKGGATNSSVVPFNASRRKA